MKSLLLTVGVHSFAQTTTCKPPIGRALWHDRIDREQKNTARALQGISNEDVDYFVKQQALVKRVDAMQCKIELDSTLNDQRKKRYLSGVENILKTFSNLYKGRQVNPSQFPAALDVYEAAMGMDIKKQSIEPLVEKSPYDVVRLVLSSNAFTDNPGLTAAKNNLLLKFCLLHPEQIFVKLRENPEVPFRDSLLKLAGYRYPKRLYDYASADNRLGYAIRNIDDPFIRTISKMAKSGGSGQLYFPFLDNITAGKQNFEEIDAVKNDDAKYYKLLVKTKMEYTGRSLNGEKIVSMGVLDTMLQTKATGYFIKTINALHNEPDAVRFRILDQLNAQELYYLVIAGERDMYTSSYVNGIYPRMLQKIGNRGDSLLMSVTFDRFKKFIRIAAGYNTLSHFLGTIPDKDKASTLMTAFVNNLEKSTGLEDGVDVADSYASIAEYIRPIADEMVRNVKENLDRSTKENNKRGVVIYNLLYKLFLSADSVKGKNIDLSREFGIPPVYNISYESLTSDSGGKVVMQVFFYGDKDGKMSWDGFAREMAASAWKKVEDNKHWVAYTSVKGKPLLVYANKWIDEEKYVGEAEKAQASLSQYLEDKNMQPAIVVHRGHSYYAPYTIEQIRPAAKIVLLGSCGGYNLIHDVLRHASDAHIIASKQTGKKDINQPFMNILNDKLRNGSNIDWIPFWNEFRRAAGNIDGFEDYIPPYKNLGVLFIKAYQSSMGGETGLM